MKITGEGLRIIKSGKDWPPVRRALLARKGLEGGSAATVKTTSGSIMFGVGERIWGSMPRGRDREDGERLPES
jgi:hypothetical protein